MENQIIIFIIGVIASIVGATIYSTFIKKQISKLSLWWIRLSKKRSKAFDGHVERAYNDEFVFIYNNTRCLRSSIFSFTFMGSALITMILGCCIYLIGIEIPSLLYEKLLDFMIFCIIIQVVVVVVFLAEASYYDNVAIACIEKRRENKKSEAE